MQLYKYQGTVSSFRFIDNGYKAHMDIVLGDISDWEKAPTRIEAFGGIANYINAIECTDAEERYLKADWFYDRNLYLHRIEIPCANGALAKIITSDDWLADEVRIFGPKEYIETCEPESMGSEQRMAWCEFRHSQWLRQNSL